MKFSTVEVKRLTDKVTDQRHKLTEADELEMERLMEEVEAVVSDPSINVIDVILLNLQIITMNYMYDTSILPDNEDIRMRKHNQHLAEWLLTMCRMVVNQAK